MDEGEGKRMSAIRNAVRTAIRTAIRIMSGRRACGKTGRISGTTGSA